MSTTTIRCEILERLRWTRFGRGVWAALGTAAGCGLPAGWVQAAIRRRIAQGVYGCRDEEVFLFKSGRAALRGLMEGLKSADSARRAAFVPDYVCNVVGGACRAAGFTVVEYPTDERCLPDWPALEDRIRRETAPVVVWCSLFGSVPALAPEAAALERANPRAFFVADECQHLVPDSPVKPRSNRAVVFSFNDKTCPGVMGGGIACSAESGVAPVFARAPFVRRALCSIALAHRWLSGLLRSGFQAIRLATGRGGAMRRRTPRNIRPACVRITIWRRNPFIGFRRPARGLACAIWTNIAGCGSKTRGHCRPA